MTVRGRRAYALRGTLAESSTGARHARHSGSAGSIGRMCPRAGLAHLMGEEPAQDETNIDEAYPDGATLLLGWAGAMRINPPGKPIPLTPSPTAQVTLTANTRRCFDESPAIRTRNYFSSQPSLS